MATEFIAKVRVGGSVGTDCDFTSLSAAETQLRCDLTASSTRVYSGTKTGTIADGATLYLWRSGVLIDPQVTATCRRAAYGGTRLMVNLVNNTAPPTTNDVWSTSAADGTTNIFTISATIGSGNGDTVILAIECDTAANADTTAASFTYVNWTTSDINYLVIRAANGNEAGSQWNTGKYRLSPSSVGTALAISTYYARAERLQLYANTRHGVSLSPNSNHDIRISACHIRQQGSVSGVYNGIHINSSSAGTTRIFNNIIVDFDRGSSTAGFGIQSVSSTNTAYIYGNTIRNCTGGISRSNGTLYLKNNIVSGCDNPSESYSGTFNAASQNNASDAVAATDYEAYSDLAFGVAADSGTTTSSSPNKLVETGQNFTSTVKVGMIVVNTTANPDTYARVTAVDSDTQLSLSDNIMGSSEAYTIYSNFQGTFSFTSATDHAITSSDATARENGFTISTDSYPGTDMNGTSRPQGTNWDIGAIEAAAAGTSSSTYSTTTTLSTSTTASTSTTQSTVSTYTLAPPDTLYCNDTLNTAQSGLQNPSSITDTTPCFSAVVTPKAGVPITQIQIQVNLNANFSGAHEWDSGWLGLGTDSVAVAGRTRDIEYGET